MRRLLLIPALFATAAVLDAVIWDQPQVTIDAPSSPEGVQVGTSVDTPTPQASSRTASAPDVPTKNSTSTLSDGGGS